MKFLAWFSAAMAWAIVVCGIAGWLIFLIDPREHDVSFGDVAATIGVLAVAGPVAFAPFAWLRTR